MCVRWGYAFSFWFGILAGVRQEGCLSPILFAIYMDVLIIRLKASGYGCQLMGEYFGCLLYADDIMLSYSLSAMLKICDDFVVEYDVKFKTGKSVAMRIGPRYNMICEPLEHSGKNLQFIQSVKYLGINLVVSYKKIKFSADHVKIKFFMLSTAYTLSVATKCSVGNLLPRICHFGDRLAKGGGGFHHLTLCLTLH